MFNFKSIKAQLIFYLIFLAIFLAVLENDYTFLFTTLVAVVSAIVVESLIIYFKTKACEITESSIITGLIIGFVLSSEEAWWKFAVAAGLAILSKYLIRFQKKHIFNPACLGIFLSTLLIGAYTQWKGTYVWYLVVPFGIYFAYKMKKTEVILGYAVVSLLLFGIQAVWQRVSFWNIFGYFSYFYIFVMVIEPKTTPLKTLGKFLFGAGTAALIFILTQIGARFDVELFSLLAMNASVPILNRLPPKGGVV